MELSGEIPVKLLCKTMGIQRSSFYAWKKHLSQPSGKEKRLLSNVLLFQLSVKFYSVGEFFQKQ